MFRIEAADDILRLLVDAHDEEFTILEFVDITGVTRSTGGTGQVPRGLTPRLFTVWRAVTLLDERGVLDIRDTPQRKNISIDPDTLEKDDSILAVEQAEFHDPIRAFVEELQSRLDSHEKVDRLVGIVIFGSVARGEADRQSDIDCFVVVDGDRTAARRLVTDIVSEFRDRRFEGDRFEFEQYVETVESATRASDNLNDIFEEGIAIFEGDGLQEIRTEVLVDE